MANGKWVSLVAKVHFTMLTKTFTMVSGTIINAMDMAFTPTKKVLDTKVIGKTTRSQAKVLKYGPKAANMWVRI